MLNALLKAITGRAGFLASLLVLLIIGVIAAAAILGLPKIEQKIVASSESALAEKLSPSDVLNELSAEGRDVLIKGEIKNPTELRSQIEAVDGVRNVVISTVKPADSEIEQPIKEPEQQAQVQEQKVGGGNSQAEIDSTEQVNNLTPTIQIITEQPASLAMRYDGGQLTLTGHLENEQVIELISASVKQAIPAASQLMIDIKNNGSSSRLSWMNEFLSVVAGVPNDAQGIIEGDDQYGVQIMPDETQTKLEEPQLKPQSESSALDNLATSEESTDAGTTVDNQAEIDVKPAVEDAQTIRQPVISGDMHPATFILDVNKRLALQTVFESGSYALSEKLKREIDAVVNMLKIYPSLALRIVGNLDFSVDPIDAEYVGEDRAREVRYYIRSQGIASNRVYAEPLPRDYAFDKRVQIIFYILDRGL